MLTISLYESIFRTSSHITDYKSNLIDNRSQLIQYSTNIFFYIISICISDVATMIPIIAGLATTLNVDILQYYILANYLELHLVVTVLQLVHPHFFKICIPFTLAAIITAFYLSLGYLWNIKILCY